MYPYIPVVDSFVYLFVSYGGIQIYSSLRIASKVKGIETPSRMHIPEIIIIRPITMKGMQIHIGIVNSQMKEG